LKGALERPSLTRDNKGVQWQTCPIETVLPAERSNQISKARV